MARQTLEVAQEREGERVDVFVGQALGLSRARLKTLFENGQVRIAGRKAKKGDRVAAKQHVEVELEEVDTTPVADAQTPLVTLYEDAHLVAVDKSPRQPAHPLRPGETGTVANALIAKYPECLEASEDPREGGLCHRLDVETSGVILAARSRDVWLQMRQAFSGREVDKRYLALVKGPLAEEGEIDLPLRHDPRHAEQMLPSVDEGDGARPALSSFEVLQRSGEYALVDVRIHTGVHHQIRAHLAAIGAPIVGDAQYGGVPVPGLDRFFLHARSLAFKHPVTGERLVIRSPVPPDLAGALQALSLQVPAP